MLRVRSLGVVPYHEASDLQRALATHTDNNYLLVLQHPHVYTLGAHADRTHVLVDPASVGATLEEADRGGDVTYHGPGQLVAYPILSVPDDPSSGPRHVHRLEEIVIRTLADVGLSRATRSDGYPGVWLGEEGSSPRKIAAIGVRTLRNGSGRRRTMHGVALNIDCDLAMFGHIVPCGIEDRGVTSLQSEGISVSFDVVAEAFTARAREIFGHLEVDRQDVHSGPAHASGEAVLERTLIRRLRQAGEVPEAALPMAERKPSWLRIPVRMGKQYTSLGKTIHDLGLVTVCEEAGCPNIYECWADGTATFMINGDRCTRACGFCQVDTRRPLPLAPDEPERVADAVERMRLAHAVITCVARDDLADDGAGAMASTVAAIRTRMPGTTIEVLISDCRGHAASLDAIFAAQPDILNHNIETVARLQRAVRPSAGYARSLAVLSRAAQSGLSTKSGLMVGLGESEEEVMATMADLRSVGVSIVTIGQYLRPSREHLPVARFWHPEEFERLKTLGAALGIAHVEASPLTRSSYHARDAAAAAHAVPVQLVHSGS